MFFKRHFIFSGRGDYQKACNNLFDIFEKRDFYIKHTWGTECQNDEYVWSEFKMRLASNLI